MHASQPRYPHEARLSPIRLDCVLDPHRLNRHSVAVTRIARRPIEAAQSEAAAGSVAHEVEKATGGSIPHRKYTVTGHRRLEQSCICIQYSKASLVG